MADSFDVLIIGGGPAGSTAATLLGQKYRLKRAYGHLKKFALYAHFEGVERDAGIDGSLTQMVRASDRWFWLIPINARKTSVGLVMDVSAYRRAGQSPEAALMANVQAYPLVARKLRGATRVTPVHATGDFSYRCRRLGGERWLLAGDAAGFIDPVWNSGVYLAILSGEKAADALNRVLRRPELQAREFGRYERRIHRVMDLYLKFVTAWYTPAFAEVFSTRRSSCGWCRPSIRSCRAPTASCSKCAGGCRFLMPWCGCKARLPSSPHGSL